jgi:membrane protein
MRISDMRKDKAWDILKDTFKSFFDKNMDMYGAALAFQMLFAIVPFLIVLIAILGFFDQEGLYQILYAQAETVIPGDASEIIEQVVEEIDASGGGLIPFALVAALWLASSAMRSAIYTLNIAYNVEETRPFWSQFLLSIVYTLGIVVSLILALVLMIIGPQLIEWITGLINLDDEFIFIWTWLRWPVAVVLLMATVAFIHFVAPDIKQKFRDIAPGSVLSVLVWIALSIGFDFYMRTFVDLSILYGSLGAIIFLMLYFYISAAVLLFGAELNSVIKRHPHH